MSSWKFLCSGLVAALLGIDVAAAQGASPRGALGGRGQQNLTDPPHCEVALLSDEPPEQLELSWRLDGADETGPLQSGSSRARVKQLEKWLAHNPSLTVCRRLYVVRAETRAELQAALTRFLNDAVRAGTRQPESGAPEQEQPAPQAESEK